MAVGSPLCRHELATKDPIHESPVIGTHVQILLSCRFHKIDGCICCWMGRAISSGGRLFEVLDADSPVLEKPDSIVLEKAKGNVEFNDVSFSYENRVPAIQHVNISAKPDQITAILGAPGSGKSTIVSLLPRFYDIGEGSITIDGHDIRDLTLDSLRINVGIVQQDVFLFSATIHDNIAYGKKDATREEVVQAAKVAQLHDHIDSLEDGYDTWPTGSRPAIDFANLGVGLVGAAERDMDKTVNLAVINKSGTAG